jgi:hypothetical protein
MTTLDEQIARLEADGCLDPDCRMCQKVFYPYFREHGDTRDWPFAPRHKASPRCQSGKYPHCTCDTCF